MGAAADEYGHHPRSLLVRYDWAARSSNVGVCSYDSTTEALEVGFQHGGRYRYSSVPESLAAPLLHEQPDEFSPGGYVTRTFGKQPERFPVEKLP
ncbi:hypothetical protein LCGC14_1490920 [marine sediment metagenome]|uniref:KTSC domain-containing protein n=1 Tax=marine sediment metagenome TaxID=412755 RepID=A0A0F9J7G0_9ZZZZ